MPGRVRRSIIKRHGFSQAEIRSAMEDALITKTKRRQTLNKSIKLTLTMFYITRKIKRYVVEKWFKEKELKMLYRYAEERSK